ncbi:hydrolase [Mycobacterium tuberculosis variant africanum MAL010118]|nr:hydrolase [Mycobacterium tuberculosis CPHL_A]KBG22486.1 hydrolase [Mycobacterium tuberculosis variant africanum MAL010074]KBH04451.1 hydrolase [Mycobacterium tuberculosis variant africanum MAL010118]CKV78294.1 hydrolase [Mycobacterium tuberculosis]CKV99983.1 hydrolase [Mycobacterium tuberculosis]
MNSITDVGGIRVGHYQRLDPDASLGAGWACGVTVVLPPPGGPVEGVPIDLRDAGEHIG